ncbi:MAG: hydroxymethylbilane synthase [Nitrospinae bacterium RIFCSPLOWO2_12_39_16]|nr:MAG: hydroxymethylbilane synthase [Bdellovibrionales bacterium RIFOXYB2_FULL_36_6]OGW13184.1 MAG: hydroxymethylbilane synthase [Nitrospinae bacterium RIFCSPLOWO2_12_39_16]HLA48059.1 hydroxymethylbilane synthase [Nitrospinota bacterium]
MNKKIRIGTRGSQLALWQANWVKSKLLEWNPGIEIEIHKIKTTGDKILDAPLSKVGGKGLFVKEIEEALFDKKIDIAVHSMKDVPTDLPEGLSISAITEREDPRDALISKDGLKLKELKKGAKIGTSSLRRQVQLLNFREDFKIYQLRGNLNTRMKKLSAGDFDAIMLAAAGVKRMGWKDKITEYLPYDIFLPAIGQGALGIEIRDSDREAGKIVERFNHRETSLCVRAERSFLERLEGGCQVPIAAFGMINGNTIKLEGLVGSIDGKILYRDTETDGENRVEELGVRLAEKLLNMGADKILKEVYGNSVFL